MPLFRLTYYTSGGPFVRDVEAADAATAEQEALASLRGTDLVRYTAEDLVILLRTAQIVGISLEPSSAVAAGRSAGLLSRIKGEEG